MNKILEKDLIEKYPRILKDMYGPMKKTCLHFGIECADGWYFLLNKVFAQIQQHIDDHCCDVVSIDGKESSVPQFVALQIKEKFGSLRIYFSGGDDYCSSIIAFAETLSFGICENCGKMNEQVGRVEKGWIQSLCASCSSEYHKEIKIDRKMAALWSTVRASRKNVNRSWDTLCDVEPTEPVILRGGFGFCKKKGKK